MKTFHKSAAVNVVTMSVLLAGLWLVAAGPVRDAPGPVSLSVQSWNEVQQWVERRQGRVVAVDVWTTTCPICIEELPKFVELQRQFNREQLALISVNCDYDGIDSKPPQFYYDHVLGSLKSHRASFPNAMLDEAFIDFLERIDLGSTPAVLVYDRSGKLARRFDNDHSNSQADDFTMDQVAELIGRLLQ